MSAGLKGSLVASKFILRLLDGIYSQTMKQSISIFIEVLPQLSTCGWHNFYDHLAYLEILKQLAAGQKCFYGRQISSMCD